MTHHTARTVFAAIGLSLALMLSSCASEAVKAENAKKKAEAAKDKADGKEYVLVYPTGSNIPVKVPKDQVASSDSQTQSDQDALRRAQERGIRPHSGN